jgi:hypothetical protein
MRGGLSIYRLKDFHDEEIKGTFYQSELQKVDVRDDDIWKIEKILKTKGKATNKPYFNIPYIYVILTLSPTLKRKGFRIVLLLLSVESLLGQYIFHHRLVSLPLVTLFGGIPIVLCYALL